jgi:hypothetical protein
MSLISSAPTQSSLIEQDETDAKRKDPFYIAKGWKVWLDALVALVQSALQFLKLVTLTNQSAAIGLTSVPLGSPTSGLYQVSWYARITTVDPVSSSLTVTLFWTEGGTALSVAGAAMTANLTTTVQSGVIDVQIDAASAISYSTAYASNTPGTMRYSLRVSVTRKA